MQHLYISYPESDYDLTHRLVDDLQAAGYAVFIDAVSDVGTLAWAAETRRAIRTCGAMIMILGRGWRRIGIRHEGVLTKRRNKPVVVLAHEPEGFIPRYLTRATIIDADAEYESLLRDLLAALPSASMLMNAPVLPGRQGQRRYRPDAHHSWTIWLVLAVIIGICLALGIVFGWIPV
jgi:hypothetical protein